MIAEVEVIDLINAIRRLPPNKVRELQDYVQYLGLRYGDPAIIDDSDEWSEEDLRDFMASSRFAELNAT